MEGPGADSEEKHEPASDIDTVVVDSLKALDPKRPIREATKYLRQKTDALRPVRTSAGSSDIEISPELSRLLLGLARLLALRKCNESFPLLGHGAPELAIAFSRGLFHILARPPNFHLKSLKRQ